MEGFTARITFKNIFSLQSFHPQILILSKKILWDLSIF